MREEMAPEDELHLLLARGWFPPLSVREYYS